MPAENSFATFVRRIRAGDSQAAEELVRQFEPMIRLEVRMGLRDSRLGRVFDSMDICQSVLASFFVRAASGQYDLEQPADLVALLVRMARNKLASQSRRHYRQRRDVRRLAGEVSEETVGAGPATPSHVVEARDLLQHFRKHLTDDERQLADWRAQGMSWESIATQAGGTAKARCKQMERALDRVAKRLGLHED